MPRWVKTSEISFKNDVTSMRALGLGRGGSTRQIAVVRWRADAANRNIHAMSQALATAYR